MLKDVLSSQINLVCQGLPFSFLSECCVYFIILRSLYLYSIEVLRITLKFYIITWRSKESQLGIVRIENMQDGWCMDICGV